MKIRLITLLISFLPTLALADDLVQQEIKLFIDPAENLLTAESVLTLGEGTTVWPDSYRLAAHVQIDALSVDGSQSGYSFENGLLKTDIPNDTQELTIRYRAVFDDPVPEDHVGIEDPSLGVTATIRPEGTYLSGQAAWHPVPVDRRGLFRVTVTGPPGLVGVTSGRFIEQTTDSMSSSTTWQTRIPEEALTLAAGPYELQRDDLGDIQVMTLFSARNSELARDYLTACRTYLELYQERFGPYPYAKFAVVENFYPTGYGLPGWTLLGSRVIRLPFLLTTSLPHEIAHAWWGNAVEIDYASGNWGEGLATYVADYYLKEDADESGREAREYRRKILREFTTLVDATQDMPLTDFRSRATKIDQAIGYGKTAMVFHMLRQLIGDEAFWAALKDVARDGNGQVYAWSDLERHFEAHSDFDLTSFFRQWTTGTGAPQLAFEEVDMIAVEDGWQVSGSVVQTARHHELAIPLRLTAGGRIYDQTIGLDGERTCFLFTVPGQPTLLELDPESHLFRSLSPEELPATVSHLRASKDPLVVISTGSDALFEASKDLLRGLQWQQAELINEKSLATQETEGRDLLFIGWPEDEALQPGLPNGVTVSPHGVDLHGQEYATDNDSVFLVTKRGNGPNVSAYFIPGSASAAKDTARRIPHYGRYSVLAFHNGKNQVKTTWSPTNSPLVIRLGEDDTP